MVSDLLVCKSGQLSCVYRSFKQASQVRLLTESYVDNGEPESAPRRQLVWRSHARAARTLQGVSKEYARLLNFRPDDDANVPLQRSTGAHWPRFRTPRKCLGYAREEIILTSDISNSEISVHTSPTPGEICSICGAVLGDTERLKCVCGALDEKGAPAARDVHEDDEEELDPTMLSEYAEEISKYMRELEVPSCCLFYVCQCRVSADSFRRSK